MFSMYFCPQELGYLLPNVNIDLVLIGPAVSKKVSGKLVQIRNVQITLQKGLYHKLHLTKPDLVIGESSPRYMHACIYVRVLYIYIFFYLTIFFIVQTCCKAEFHLRGVQLL